MAGAVGRERICEDNNEIWALRLRALNKQIYGQRVNPNLLKVMIVMLSGWEF